MNRIVRRLTVAVVPAITMLTAPAYALQPLGAFVASAKDRNPDNRQATFTAQQKDAQKDVATAAYLPSFTAQGQYTRNQFESAITLPGEGTFVISPQNGLDAYFTVAVPIINVGAWEQRRAARINADVSAASLANTQVSVESSVTQAYYQLLGSEAVLFAAKQALEYASSNVKTVKDRVDLGTASELDLQRANADSSRAEQDLASADQGVVNGRRALESLSRLTPEPATRANYVPDDLHDESPLDAWLQPDSDGSLVAVRPAVLSAEAAVASRTAAKANWLPTIAAQGQEHVTNAGGFTGHYEVFTGTATATWKLDFSLGPNVRAQTAALGAAEAAEDKSRRAAEDAIYQAWQQVRVDIVKSRASRDEVKSTTLALTLARDRYANGVALQLEVVQAQRDFFQAAVNMAQADFDLQYARALLRLSARRSAVGETK